MTSPVMKSQNAAVDGKTTNSVKDVIEGTGNIKYKNAGEYFNYINDIGNRTDLTSVQKFAKIQEEYVALEVKGDVTVVSDMQFLKSDVFVDGRMNIVCQTK